MESHMQIMAPMYKKNFQTKMRRLYKRENVSERFKKKMLSYLILTF